MEFHWLTAPVEILGDDQGNCASRNAHGAGSTGRVRTAAPGAFAGSEYEFEADMVVYAVGHPGQFRHRANLEYPAERNGGTLRRTRSCHVPGRRLCRGDIVAGAATVIKAMGAGRKAADGIKATFRIGGRQLRFRPGTDRSSAVGSPRNNGTWSVFDWTPAEAVEKSDEEGCHGRA